jgi:hypothetical protein
MWVRPGVQGLAVVKRSGSLGSLDSRSLRRCGGRGRGAEAGG